MRRALAIGLVAVVLGLAVAVVSHIHGVTDPAKPHPFGEQIGLGQAKLGFVAANLPAVLVIATLIGWLVLDPSRRLPQKLFWPYTSRAPPLSPS